MAHGRFPEGACFVNGARGEVAVERDVIAALASGKLAGAYLHAARHSLGQNEAIFDIFRENLARWRAGQPLRNDVDGLG